MNARLTCLPSIAASLAAALGLAGCGGGGDGTATTMPPTPVPTLAETLPDPDNSFASVSSGLRSIWAANSVELPGDDLRVTSVSSDGANGFHLTYVQDGVENSIHFTAADYDTPSCSGCS